MTFNHITRVNGKSDGIMDYATEYESKSNTINEIYDKE